MGGLFSFFIPARVYVINRGGFPPKKKYALFQCIQDILDQQATLNDLHLCIQENGSQLLDIAINIKNILGPMEEDLFGRFQPTLKGRDLTPLHFAYLSGRPDIFSLLMAEGAKLDTAFFYQCTSLDPKLNKKNKRYDSTLHLNLTQYEYAPVDTLATTELREAYFIELLYRKELNAVMDIITRRLNTLHKRDSEYELVTSAYSVKFALELLPPIAIIKQSLGSLNHSYISFFKKLILELNQLIQQAGKANDIFSTYDLNSIKTAQRIFIQLRDCFDEILHNYIYPNNPIEKIHLERVNKILNQYRHYDRDYKKQNYKDRIIRSINFTCTMLYKYEDEAHHPRELSSLIFFGAANMRRMSDDDYFLYRESLIEFAESQLQIYAKILSDNRLKVIANALKQLSGFLEIKQLKSILRNISVYLETSKESLGQELDQTIDAHLAHFAENTRTTRNSSHRLSR